MALVNRCKRSCSSVCFKLILTFFVVICSFWIWRILFRESYSQVSTYVDGIFLPNHACSEGWLNNYFYQLCSNHSDQVIFGTICDEICYHGDVVVKNCFVHHSETVVMEILMNQKPMIFKLKSSHPHFDESVLEQLDAIWEYWVKDHEFPIYLLHQFIVDNFQTFLGNNARNIAEKQRQAILDRILPASTWKLSRKQLMFLYTLLQRDEMLTLIYYQHLKHVPTFKGYCGHLYAVEQLTPLDTLFPAMHSTMAWQKRAILSKSLLDLVSELSSADAGPLHVCDVKEADLGFTKNLQVKTMDFDLVFTDKRTNELVSQSACGSDDECDFFDCRSICNITSRKCTEKRTTNNLQLLCRKIFKQRWPLKGLLSDIPSSVAASLYPLLEQCSSDAFGRLTWLDSRVRRMIDEITSILTKEIVTDKE